MPMSVKMPILTFAAIALIQSAMGIKVKNSQRNSTIAQIIRKTTQSSGPINFYLLLFWLYNNNYNNYNYYY